MQLYAPNTQMLLLYGRLTSLWYRIIVKNQAHKFFWTHTLTHTPFHPHAQDSTALKIKGDNEHIRSRRQPSRHPFRHFCSSLNVDNVLCRIFTETLNRLLPSLCLEQDAGRWLSDTWSCLNDNPNCTVAIVYMENCYAQARFMGCFSPCNYSKWELPKKLWNNRASK